MTTLGRILQLYLWSIVTLVKKSLVHCRVTLLSLIAVTE